MEVKRRTLIYSVTILYDEIKITLMRRVQEVPLDGIGQKHFGLIDENDADMSKEKRRRDSRALIGAEDRSLIGSNTRISQYTQSENALKQRLKDIDHFHQQTNRRISHETRELKEILHGLQKDLKFSRPLRHYVPTQLEETRQVQPIRTRRNTTNSFPTAVVKLEVKHKGVDDVMSETDKLPAVEIPSQEYLTKRRRSNSMPITQEAPRELRNIQEEEEDTRQPTGEGGETGHKEQSVLELAFKKSTEESIEHDTRQTTANDSSRNERIYNKRVSAEQLLQNARKRSTASAGQAYSNAFLGRFITSSENGGGEAQAVAVQPSRLRRMTVAHRADVTDLPRKRLSVQEISPFSSSFQPTLRKSSLSYPQWSGNLSRNLNPSAGDTSPRRTSPLVEMADEFEGSAPRRRASVAYRTARSRRKTSTLPPLMEDSTAKNSAENKVWNDLSKCRYLRRQESELTIEDIFRKD